jgi:hypothetical protein
MTGEAFTPEVAARRAAIVRRWQRTRRPIRSRPGWPAGLESLPEWFIRYGWSLMRAKDKATYPGVFDEVHRLPSCPVSDLNVPWRIPEQIGRPAALARIADNPHMRLCTHCFTPRELELMAIHTLDPRMRELGRIRIGRQVPTGSSGKTRPEKLDRFRFTSSSEKTIRHVAEAYGGEAVEWSPPDGRKQWEVITDAQRIPILIPPQPLTQFYEQWSGGGCQRRCDGLRELLSDVPCICADNGQEGADRDCKPTTRINVVCRDIPGVGLFRLESHGYYAAVELPQLAELLEKAAGTDFRLEAWLGLEERVISRPGIGTRRFMVPTIEMDITPAQLLASGTGPAALESGPKALPAGDDVADAEVVNDPQGLDDALRELDAVADTLGYGRVQLAREYTLANGGNLVDANADQINAFRHMLEERLDDFVRGNA